MNKIYNLENIVTFTNEIISQLKGFKIKNYDNELCVIYISYLNTKIISFDFDDNEMNVDVINTNEFFDQRFSNIDQIEEAIKNCNNILTCVKLLMDNKKNFLNIAEKDGLLDV